MFVFVTEDAPEGTVSLCGTCGLELCELWEEKLHRSAASARYKVCLS